MTADRLADCYLQSSNSSQRNVNSMYCNCSQLKETARARSPSTCSAPCHVTLYSPNVYGARFMGNAETQILGGIYNVAVGGRLHNERDLHRTALTPAGCINQHSNSITCNACCTMQINCSTLHTLMKCPMGLPLTWSRAHENGNGGKAKERSSAVGQVS